MGVTLVEVSVNVSATVSSEIVEGVQEIGRVIETVVEGDSWVIAGLVGGISVIQSIPAIRTSCTKRVRHVIKGN